MALTAERGCRVRSAEACRRHGTGPAARSQVRSAPGVGSPTHADGPGASHGAWVRSALLAAPPCSGPIYPVSHWVRLVELPARVNAIIIFPILPLGSFGQSRKVDPVPHWVRLA